MTRLLLQTLDRFGVVVLPRWRVERFPMATCLHGLFGLLRIDCVLDVGANVGQYRNFLRHEVGYTGRIVSFEPVPHNVAILRERAARDPGWQVEPYALGAKSGQAEFNVLADTVFSSFLQPNDTSAGLFRDASAVSQRIVVEVRTLDEVLGEIESRHGTLRTYLKLDTQGYDLEVVKGGAASMSRICALQTEASVKPIYCDMPDHVTTIRHLESLGFELTGLFPVNSGTFPRLVEFDCVMVSSSRLAASSSA